MNNSTYKTYEDNYKLLKIEQNLSMKKDREKKEFELVHMQSLLGEGLTQQKDTLFSIQFKIFIAVDIPI